MKISKSKQLTRQSKGKKAQYSEFDSDYWRNEVIQIGVLPDGRQLIASLPMLGTSWCPKIVSIDYVASFSQDLESSSLDTRFHMPLLFQDFEIERIEIEFVGGDEPLILDLQRLDSPRAETEYPNLSWSGKSRLELSLQISRQYCQGFVAYIYAHGKGRRNAVAKLSLDNLK